MGGVYVFRIYNITDFLFSKQIDPIYVMDFIDFHRCSLIFIDFLSIFMDYHRFS